MGAYHAASCFVLPSHSENSGVVVAEALACETPVIVTNKVNIWKNILSENAGFVSEDTIEGLTGSIKSWMALDQIQYQKTKENGYCIKSP